jgi:hypothetical protein
MELKPIRFISETIEVHYDQPLVLEKKPKQPDGFTWREETFRVTELLSEWADFARRGRSGRNMQPAHAAVAARRGSWGVGVFYFRVRTDSGRFFDIYYDRAPKDASHRKGQWYVFQELA